MIAGSPLVQSPASTFTPALLESIADFVAIDCRCLVDLAGQAPVRGEIDEHRLAPLHVARDSRLGPRFRAAKRRATASGCWRGDDRHIDSADDCDRASRHSRVCLPFALQRPAPTAEDTGRSRDNSADHKATLAAGRQSSQCRPRPSRAIGIARKRCSRAIHAPGSGQHALQARERTRPRRNGSASPSPSAANISTDPQPAAAAPCPVRRRGTAPRKASRQKPPARRFRNYPPGALLRRAPAIRTGRSRFA